jgi:hypothetical protein
VDRCSNGELRANGRLPAGSHATPGRLRRVDDCRVLHDRGRPYPSDRAGRPYFDFFGRSALGPVPLFEVTDIGEAHEDLRAAGIEVVGSPGRDKDWEWVHFRAPDGNLYELGGRPTLYSPGPPDAL